MFLSRKYEGRIRARGMASAISLFVVAEHVEHIATLKKLRMQAGVAESCGLYCLHEHIKSLEIVTAPSVLAKVKESGSDKIGSGRVANRT
ncbi:hypothetical protein [Paenibacillus polymyxa]|uniref:hypothetical protein n=1 Tax=Paenibacillus polymyxa TaxID=1406 RepID=UPI00234AFBF8|nr:hypothetical protein [Paenibacillus polymyxa]WCM62306.1 hypothetical protein OYT09_04865 [Paenibacillus polymyxa]